MDEKFKILIKKLLNLIFSKDNMSFNIALRIFIKENNYHLKFNEFKIYINGSYIFRINTNGGYQFLNIPYHKTKKILSHNELDIENANLYFYSYINKLDGCELRLKSIFLLNPIINLKTKIITNVSKKIIAPIKINIEEIKEIIIPPISKQNSNEDIFNFDEYNDFLN